MERQFPEGFWWGTAASSPQAEGAAPASDWIPWENAGHVPPSGDGNGFAQRYAEDFALYTSFGLPHHRLGIDWARIEPEEGHRDPAAVEHYQAMLLAARGAGIETWACLHHFVLPAWVASGGVGFSDERARTYFWRRHLDFVAEEYGDLVFGWQPVNEPASYAANGFIAGIFPPGLQDFALAMTALEGAHLANLLAWQVLRQTGKPVATIHPAVPLYPGDASPESAMLTDSLDAVMWCWTRAIRDGVLDLPGRDPVDVAEHTGAFDLIGFSYYSAATVPGELRLGPYPPDGETGPLGYVPWSDGLGITLDRIVDELPDKPILIAEHGVGTIDDASRCAVLTESLALVADRLAQGVDIRGFFHWTGIDNYEWQYGWDVPFGLFDRDRNPRPSAELLRHVATTGRLAAASPDASANSAGRVSGGR